MRQVLIAASLYIQMKNNYCFRMDKKTPIFVFIYIYGRNMVFHQPGTQVIDTVIDIVIDKVIDNTLSMIIIRRELMLMVYD